ncbi:helix-turn-helix transcriptional regulator [Microcoleus sp. FACHB-1515]|uniref:AraC family transcriptional regulator n=1 Tax=Cyanophyceae TaxID=3028117 RepID=UPI001682868C|nr:AraC family transcriptional regulator [Microcoleus sp. FACHB-1515]MBD2091394.1 helix-turn-helix transcriptional regulator [Microcoleus sp. FACHB-1515]
MTCLPSQDDPTLFDQAVQLDRTDDRETIERFSADVGQGYSRSIELRDGLELEISHYQPCSNRIIKLPERSHPLEYLFALSGSQQSNDHIICSGKYSLCGSGIAPSETLEISDVEPILTLNVHIDPALFQQFWGAIDTPQVKHLFRSNQEYYVGCGQTTIAMQTAIQQILQCPYQSVTKRIYLESKVWELLALLIEQTAEPEKSIDFALKPDDIDRIHHASEILLKQLNNPPSLLELARQVGLNDCTLKRGFRQVFGTTAFGFLHDRRLEQARQLLAERRLNVSEVARQVGFANRSYFATAFKKKFGMNPKEYLDRKNSA